MYRNGSPLKIKLQNKESHQKNDNIEKHCQMKTKILFAIQLLVVFHVAKTQQVPDFKTLDQYFDTLEKYNQFMGSIAISRHDKIIYSRSVGFCDLGNNIPANETSKYRIGSITKTFTAVLTLMAVESGLLDLNQSINQFFPGIRNSEKITISNLLNHRSGIPNFTDDPAYLTWNTQYKTPKELLAIIETGGSDFEPDAQAAYSNSNYLLLTWILEKAYDKPYSKLVKEHITEPLGLVHTTMGEDIDPFDSDCKSYRFAGRWVEQPETNMSIPLGAGGIVSTPSDIVKFSNALFSGQLIKDKSVEWMKTIRDQFGMGLFVFPFHERKVYGHIGGIDGFYSIFGHFQEDGISFAILSNGLNHDNNSISIAVLNTVFGLPVEIPSFNNIEVDVELLEIYSGIYSSDQFPLKITITRVEYTLVGQATGQPSFTLQAEGSHRFSFAPARLTLTFNPDERTMLLEQGGFKFLLKKE